MQPTGLPSREKRGSDSVLFNRMKASAATSRAVTADAIDRRPLGSVVIPAHQEAPVIRRCLDALYTGIDHQDLDVVVVCNGCTDDTAQIARESPYPVAVFDLPVASKPAALRCGDANARVLPRLYLDADVILRGDSAVEVLRRLADGAVAARPPLAYDYSHSTGLVRSYYRARSRMPAVLGSLWGAGVYGVSEVGRGRFGDFPDVTADDAWIDQQFTRDEIEIVDCAPVVVIAPRRAGDLLRVLRRVYRGKTDGDAADAEVRTSETTRSAVSDLRRLAGAGPRPAMDALTYAGMAIIARLMLRLAPGAGRAGAHRWERDHSTRNST